MAMPTICLNMIVKNEALIIPRCLASMRAHLDYWVIVDTGSSDETERLVAECLAGVPGELHKRPWRDFGHNRTEAVRLAENKADYLLLCDADMALVVRDPDWKQSLAADAYDVKQTHDDGFTYRNIRLINARLSGARRWRYWGVTHEYCGTVDFDSFTKPALFDAIEFRDYSDGGSKEQKLPRDAAMLEREIAHASELEARALTAPLDEEATARLVELRRLLPRYYFYLAQTYRELGRLEESTAFYERHAQVGVWDEEVWQSFYQVARLAERLGRTEQEVVSLFLRAYEKRPTRAEPLVDLARYLRERSRYASAHLFAARAKDLPFPKGDTLFLEPSYYHWRALDEFAVTGSWIGEWPAALRVWEALLERTDLPDPDRDRIRANVELGRDALAKAEQGRS